MNLDELVQEVLVLNAAITIIVRFTPHGTEDFPNILKGLREVRARKESELKAKQEQPPYELGRFQT